MSSTSNYNAITNLVETVIDYLVVDTAEINNANIQNLDADVGIIDTLTSTTATLTSANIPTLTTTTGGITNLNTNNIQANPVSSTVSLYTTGTGLLTIGNTSNTNPLAIDSSAILATNKNLTLQGTGKITSPSILVSSLTASKIVKTDASDNLVSSLYDETTLPVSTPQQTALNLKANIDNPTFTTGIGLTSGNITISSGNLNCNTIRALSAGDTVSLFSTSTGAINLGNFFSINPFTISVNLVIAVGRNLTLSGTGKITSPSILVSGLTASKLVLTDASKNLVSSAYDETTLPVSTPQQTALNLKANIDNPTFTTGIGLTSGNITISSGNLNCNTIRAVSTGATISLFSTSTGAINFGNFFSSNPFTISVNLVIAVGRNLTLSGTGKISTPNILVSGLTASKIVLTDASKNLVSSSYDETTLPVSTPQQTALNLKSNIDAPVFTSSIGLTSGNLTISSGKILNNTYTGLLTSSNLSLGESGDTGIISTTRDLYLGSVASNKGLYCNYFTPLQITDNLNFSNSQTTGNINIQPSATSGSITIGNLTSSSDSGTLTINKNTVMPTAKTFKCDNYQATSATTTTNICANLTSGDLYIGSAQTTGDIFIHNSTFVSGGIIVCNRPTQIDTIQSFTKATASLYDDMTTSNITVGAGLTTGTLNLGASSGTAKTQINGKITLYSGTTDKTAYMNSGSGNTLFQSPRLTNNYISSTTYTNAPTDNWSVWESNTVNSFSSEASAIVQNGETTMIINPGDQSVLWWLDEDSMNTSNNYAWSGWKISTAGVFTLSSDRRLKRDITPLTEDNILDKLSLLEIVSYKWKPPTPEKEFKNGVLRGKYKETHLGYIAQDVKKIFPDVVERENEDAYFTIKREDLTTYFHLGVQELIKQNKEQKTQIEEILLQVDTLKSENINLTERLVRLEQILLNP